MLAYLSNYVAPGDYAMAVTLVTFQPGELERTVDVEIFNDNLAEVSETFFGGLRLPAGSTALVEFGQDSADATIVDNDCKY